MKWFSKKRCKSGTHRNGKKCVKNKSGERESLELSSSSSLKCNLDGKDFCKQGDKPLKSPIGYTGGKGKLANQIIPKIPKHKTYVEAFAGGASIFLRKPLAKNNILNDKDKNIVKIHRAMKSGSALNKCNMYPSKERFERIKKKKKKSVCDLFYLNKFSFGSQSKNYAVSKTKTKCKESGIKYQKAHQRDYKEKLKETQIYNQDFSEVMKRWDSPETFHYLDPPYVVGGDSYEVNGVNPKDVCNVAKKMKGKVMISYDNHPEVRRACKGMHFKTLNTKYSLNNLNHEHKKVKEVLITNYPI